MTGGAKPRISRGGQGGVSDPAAALAAVRAITRVIAGEAGVHEVLVRAAEATREVVPCDRLGLALLASAWPARPEATAAGGPLPSDAGGIGDRGDGSGGGGMGGMGDGGGGGGLPRIEIDILAAEADGTAVLDREVNRYGMRSVLQAELRGSGGGEGYLWFASSRTDAYSAPHRAIAGCVADLVAVALARERLADEERERRRSGEALEALLPALASALDTQQVFARLAAAARQVIPHDFLGLGLLSADRTRVQIHATSEEAVTGRPVIPLSERMLGTLGWEAFLAHDLTLLPGTTVVRWHLGAMPAPAGAGTGTGAGATIDHDVGPEAHRLLREAGVRSCLRVPVRLHGEVAGGLNFLSRQPGFFCAEQADLARRIADHVALALAHERLADEQRRAAEAAESARQLEARVGRLTAELAARGRHRVVGRSRPWQEVLAQATKVAATETNVLLTGESGSGKEVVARFVHQASPRKGGPFVALNCAALPDPLLESELFGHEKGAFTGALAMKPGSLDQAAGGVLFLDEVGEMSLLVQAKLLRVLEQREFQRLGGTRPVKADVRLVAATNRDLPAAIARGQFREDLYYRLHVFEIRLPPLRERRDDILPLVEAFLEELRTTMGRPGAGLSREAREKLLVYSWPGNVRELRNALERALILCEGGLITGDHLPIALGGPGRGGPAAEPGWASRPAGGGSAGTLAGTAAAGVGGDARVSAAGPELPPEGLALDAVERDLVVQALERSRGNRSQAARLLRLTRAQLYTRLARYGLH